MYLSHKDPHLPFFPSEEFVGTSRGGPYGDVVSELDGSVGAVIKALQDTDLAKKTLVIFTSDNGPWYDGSPAGFRGRKGQSYEGGFRVPMIAWWPGTIEPNATVSDPVMNIDLFPTLMSLAGVRTPSDRTIDGIDLSGIIDSSSREKPELTNRELYFFHDYDVEAIRKGKWKFYASTNHYTWPIPLDKPASFVGRTAGMRDYYPPNSSEPIHTLGTFPNMYDLQHDPGECYNLVESEPEQAADLAACLAEWKSNFYANPRGWRDSEFEATRNDEAR